MAPDDEDKFGLNKKLSKPARRLRRKTLVKPIHKFAKQHASDFKQEDHEVQIIYNLVTTNQEGKTIKREHNTKVFNVYGGKYKIRKAIESNNRETYELLNDSYDFTLDEFSIKRIYIDDVKKA